MTLPPKEPKGYLEIADHSRGFQILAKKEDAEALASLVLQRGISCHRLADTQPGYDTLQFFDGVPRSAVAEILEAYKSAKGS